MNKKNEIAIKEKEKNTLEVNQEVADNIQKILGVKNLKIMNKFVNQLVKVFPDRSPDTNKDNLMTALSIIGDIKPKDAMETMLISQLIGAYNLSMDFMSRSQQTNLSTELIDKNIERATKLTRSYIAGMEALTRYRTKGQQKMIIKRVNVNSGAQAIIGNIQGKGGEGNNET